MAKQILKIGIISKEDYKKRTIAIARGKHIVKKKEPKIWSALTHMYMQSSRPRIYED